MFSNSVNFYPPEQMLQLLLQFPSLSGVMLLVHPPSHCHHPTKETPNMYEYKKVQYKFNSLIESSKQTKKEQ